MLFIVLDLEWNNAYGSKKKGFFNEIIEIGAVLLDENLDIVDTFSTFIKAQIGKRIRGVIKELTHITNEDLKTGIEFSKAMSKIKKWINNRENVMLTWGDTDIRVLIENCEYFYKDTNIPILTNYANLQSYFINVVKDSGGKQIGLQNAAELCNIDTNNLNQHRALDDSILTAKLFKKIYEKEKFKDYVIKCNDEFYKKLLFKPYYITDINSPFVDKSMFSYFCEICGKPADIIEKWKYSKKGFNSEYYCADCDNHVHATIRVKRHYDHVNTNKVIKKIEKPEKTDENEESEADKIDQLEVKSENS